MSKDEPTHREAEIARKSAPLAIHRQENRNAEISDRERRMHDARRYLNTKGNVDARKMENRRSQGRNCHLSRIRDNQTDKVRNFMVPEIENKDNEIRSEDDHDNDDDGMFCQTEEWQMEDTSTCSSTGKSIRDRGWSKGERRSNGSHPLYRKQRSENDIQRLKMKIHNSGKSCGAREKTGIDQISDSSDKPETCSETEKPRLSKVQRLRLKKTELDDSGKLVSAKKKSGDSLGGSQKKDKVRGISSSKRLQVPEGNVVRFRCDFPSTQTKVMLARGWKQVKAEDTGWNVWWCETSDVRQALDMKLESHQKIPHFRNHYELTRKNYLWRNLKRYKKLLLKSKKIAEAALCDSMPITFELPNDYQMFVEEYQKQQGATWIVKPVGRSQGKGIFLFRRLKDLAEWKAKEQNNHSAHHAETPPITFVVQKYVDDPYLLAGRKFDLRIYVLVTSFQPLKVWLAREGFARLSGELFDLNNIDDSRVHLTNMAIQLRTISKDAEGSARKEKVKQGYKWPLVKVMQYLANSHGLPVVWNLLRRIAGVIMASLLAVQPVIMQGKNSFELYGYDVLLDESLTPWLLEVNASPALTGTDSEDYRLKFDLIDDVLNILDLEARFSGREIRIGGFDLLWDDGPVWSPYPNATIGSDTEEETNTDVRRLNIFLGAKNDREKQLHSLEEVLRG